MSKSNWHDIASAPRDGTPFLTIRRTVEAPGYAMGVAQYIGRENEPWLYEMIYMHEGEFMEVFTHWHELPAPPEAH